MKKALPYLISLVGGWLVFSLLVKSQFDSDAVAQSILTPQEESAIQSQQKILKEIMELYATQALEPPKDLVACAQEIFAMRRNGKCRDKFTCYLSPEDAKRKKEDFAGQFGGIGIIIIQKDNRVIVKELIAGAPAEQAGIKPGDVIVRVGDKKPADVQEAADLMRGKIGTKVTVTVLRGKNQKELAFTLTRKKIVVQSVKWSIAPGNPNIGVVAISRFDYSVPDEFYDALDEFENRQVHGIVIDLRDNPGGLVNSATGLLGYIREAGDRILTIRKRHKEEIIPDREPSTLAELLHDRKVLVLINEYSASASEIVAGAMKDWGYTIAGEKSYGKGVGQTAFDLSDGGQLWLTTFEFLVGNRKTPIRDKGVVPTVEIKSPKECMKVCGGKEIAEEYKGGKKDIQLEKAIEILNACVKRNSESKNCDPVVEKK
ncbi:MAG: S41 family peptidase [bacterium]